MSTLMDSTQFRNRSWMWIASAFAAALMLAAIATPKLMRSRIAADQVMRVKGQLASESELKSYDAYYDAPKGKPAMSGRYTATSPASVAMPGMIAPDRKMIRTTSLELVVQHPAEAAERILTLAERVGGFLVSSEVRGGQMRPQDR